MNTPQNQIVQSYPHKWLSKIDLGIVLLLKLSCSVLQLDVRWQHSLLRIKQTGEIHMYIEWKKAWIVAFKRNFLPGCGALNINYYILPLLISINIHLLQ
jgi:hypothetical protein